MASLRSRDVAHIKSVVKIVAPVLLHVWQRKRLVWFGFSRIAPIATGCALIAAGVSIEILTVKAFVDNPASVAIWAFVRIVLVFPVFGFARLVVHRISHFGLENHPFAGYGKDFREPYVFGWNPELPAG